MMKIGREKIAAAGRLAANVLIVNNYRDMDDDKAVWKRTTVVIFGRKVMGMAYLLLSYPDLEQACNKHRCRPRSGLGITARNLLMFSLMFLFILVINTL